jgi:hypothetical protein
MGHYPDMGLTMRTYSLVGFVALGLMACATTENYEKILNGFVGAPEASLIEAWGPPDSVYNLAEKKYLTYNRSKTEVNPGSPPTYNTNCFFGICTTGTFGGTGGWVSQLNCKTVFTLIGGKVSAWKHDGDDCKA